MDALSRLTQLCDLGISKGCTALSPCSPVLGTLQTPNILLVNCLFCLKEPVAFLFLNQRTRLYRKQTQNTKTHMRTHKHFTPLLLQDGSHNNVQSLQSLPVNTVLLPSPQILTYLFLFHLLRHHSAFHMGRPLSIQYPLAF